MGQLFETIHETNKKRKKKNMIIVKSMISSCISALGGAFVVYGEIDDAPGLGGIGLILIGVSFYLNLKNNKK